MNDTRGKGLASNIGKAEKVETDDKGRAWGDYLRVRVSIKVSEPLMRCVSVFSQKKRTTEVYHVMYEKVPLFCFSCGVVGHSSVACPKPSERDAEGYLPYHGSFLCVPDERRKTTATRSGQSSFSGNFSDPGSGHSGSKGPQGDGGGEATSLSKSKNSRGCRSPIGVLARKDGSKEVGKMTGDDGRISGQKRKVYRPKNQTPVDQEGNMELMLVPVIKHGTKDPIPEAIGDEGAEPVADSNKKQKTSAPTIST